MAISPLGALALRSAALNRRYRLGGMPSTPYNALHARSVGMNALYGLPRRPNPGGKTPGGSKPFPHNSPTPTDPYADYPTYGNVDPMTYWKQAQGVASGFINPLLAGLAAQRTAMENHLGDVASAHGQALVNALVQGAQPVKQAYQDATVGAAATADAAANSLAAQGAGATHDLAAKLAQINANPSNAAEVAKTYADAGGANYVKNSADVQALLARGAEANAYQAKLPQIAQIETARSLANALANASNQFYQQEGDVRTKGLDTAKDAFNFNFGRAQDAADKKYQRDTTIFGAKHQDAVTQAEMNQKQALAEFNARQKDKDRLSKEYLTLTALRTASTDKRAIANLNARIKQNIADQHSNDLALQRANQRAMLGDTLNTRTTIASNANTTRSTIAADNRAAADARAKADRENAKAIAAMKASGKSGSGRATVDTPGSVPRQRVISAMQSAVINTDTGRIRDRLVRASDPDMAIYTAINAAIRQQGIDPYSKTGTDLRRAFYQQIQGMPGQLADGTVVPYQVPHNKKINIKLPSP